MINHVWTLLCIKSIVDSQTNNISVFDIFEALEVEIPPLPKVDEGDVDRFVLPIQYQIVSLWSKSSNEEETGDIRIAVLDPNGTEINSIDIKLNIPKENRRMRTIHQIQGLQINKSGIYSYNVMFKQSGDRTYSKVAEIPLEIRLKRT